MEYHVPSVWLAAQVLKLLSRHKYKCCSLKDIAQKLDASPTTCLRVLRTLEAENFVHYDTETKKLHCKNFVTTISTHGNALNILKEAMPL